MRKTLYLGAEQFEILDRHDSLLEFRDIAAAVDFLRRFGDTAGLIAALRSELIDHLHDIQRLDAEETLKRLASLLVSGRVRIIRSTHQSGGGSAREEAAPVQQRAQQGRGTPLKPTAWIEINLRDMEGQPVPNMKYKIKLPDGSVRTGNLDLFGHAEFYEINKGTCEVRFPELDAEAWERI